MKQTWPNLLWLLVLSVIMLGGLSAILSFAEIEIVVSQWSPTIQLPREKGSAYASIVGSAVTWVGGSIGLYTYLLNRDQRERHNRAQERRERDLAELQRLQADFAALLTDFAKDSTLARINAAVGMAEIAVKPDPRYLGKNNVVEPDPREPIKLKINALSVDVWPWPDRFRSLKTPRNYPYFVSVANRLSAAIHQWEDEASRAQAVRVLQEMAAWAIDVGTDEPLLHALVNALASSNRTAWAMLRDQAARCLAAEMERDELAKLLDIEPIEEKHSRGLEEFLKLLSGSLADIPIYRVSRQVWQMDDEHKLKRSELVDRFCSLGRGFWATRDALANALCSLSAPRDSLVAELPENISREEIVRWRSRGSRPTDKSELKVRRLQDRRALDLRNVIMFRAACDKAFLCGAKLTGAFFAEANLLGAFLTGAQCERANFTGADLRMAWFRFATISEAGFADADCLSAKFDCANCSRTIFIGANCDGGTFAGSYCNGIRFEDARCIQVDFRESNLTSSKFENAKCFNAIFEGADCSRGRFHSAALAGAKFGQVDGIHAKFEDREWRFADFHVYNYDLVTDIHTRTDELDNDLIQFLEDRHVDGNSKS